MRRVARVALSAASLAVTGLLLVALPYVVGVDWHQIGAVLAGLNTGTVLGLTALWLLGLATYTFVLTASLPGLRHHQAFLLNAAGSAISNVLPFGGAAGVAVTFAMCRGWGFRSGPVAVSTVVTGVWNVLVKLLLPVLGIGALLAAHEVPDRRLGVAAVLGCTALLGLAGALALALRSERAAGRTGNLLTWLAGRLPHRLRPGTHRLAGAVPRLRRTTISVLRSGWRGLTLGMAGYLALQAALLIGCLHATGAMGVPGGIGWAEAIAAFALNRILTTAVITPGGTGITETGTAALLIHLGAPGAPAATAVLLNMLLTHTLEIPLGALAGAVFPLTRSGPGEPPPDQASAKTDLAHL